LYKTSLARSPVESLEKLSIDIARADARNSRVRKLSCVGTGIPNPACRVGWQHEVCSDSQVHEPRFERQARASYPLSERLP
jgi:hypothetical protein